MNTSLLVIYTGCAIIFGAAFSGAIGALFNLAAIALGLVIVFRAIDRT